METFNLIVSICSGVSVIMALLVALIKPLRERITKSKEREEAINKNFAQVKKEVAGIKTDINGVKQDIERNEALRARSQILRFADEIYQEQLHTKEHFEEILSAIDAYNLFCEKHPEFPNMKTQAAQRRINAVYQKCIEEHTFLDSKEDHNEDK